MHVAMEARAYISDPEHLQVCIYSGMLCPIAGGPTVAPAGKLNKGEKEKDVVLENWSLQKLAILRGESNW